MLCFTERHVFLEVMFYLRVGIIVGIIGGHILLLGDVILGEHVLQEGISYWMICDLLYRGTHLIRGQV